MEFTVDRCKIVLETCCHDNCGITWGMTEGFKKERLNDGKAFYCPNGHRQYYTKSKAQELKDMKARLKSEKEEKERYRNRMLHFKEESEHRERQVRGHKAWSTRVKNSISRGQCPCCGDHFEDLKIHMSSKHPDYKVEES